MRGEIEKILTAFNDGGVRYLVVGGLAVVLHGEDLIALKRQAGRSQDLADIEALERVREKRGEAP